MSHPTLLLLFRRQLPRLQVLQGCCILPDVVAAALLLLLRN
jgi:hypothetical protein